MIRPWKDWSRADKIALTGIIATIIVTIVVGLYPDQARAVVAKTSVPWRVVFLPVPLWLVVFLMAGEVLLLRVLRRAVDPEELKLLESLKNGRLPLHELTKVMGLRSEVMKLHIVNLRKKGYLTAPVIRLSSSDELDMIELSQAGRLLLRKRGLL